MFEPQAAGRDRQDLAAALRALRKAAGLSGERLATKTHMSQSKISKIETGKALPTIIDVERILHALEVPPQESSALLQLARVANVQFVSRRQLRRIGGTHRQAEIDALARKSSHVRYVLPTMLCGLLQTPEYMRSDLCHADSHVSEEQRPAVLAAKLQRQQVLYRADKRFSFLLTEAAVRIQVAAAVAMAGQVDHLLTVGRLPSVGIEVVPLNAPMQSPPLNMFVIYDDRLVVIETEAGSTALRDPVDINEHLGLFEQFRRNALKDTACAEFLRAIAEEFRAANT